MSLATITHETQRLASMRPTTARPIFVTCPDCRSNYKAHGVPDAEEFLEKHSEHRLWMQPHLGIPQASQERRRKPRQKPSQKPRKK